MAKPRKDPVEILDRFLLSDHAPENSMGISDIDGFLTGIVIGPSLIRPSEWLPVVWGGDSPKFKDTKQAASVMAALMERYNQIVAGFLAVPPIFEPIFWETNDGLVIAADWAEGFNDAIKLNPKAWQPLFNNAEAAKLLEPVQILCGERGKQFDAKVEAEMMRKAGDQITESIIGIHAFWKPDNS